MTLNMLNIAKICRICLAEGARNIFDRTNFSTSPIGGGVECVASLENLLEKMRYVTMVQIKENDTLPKMICDCCIIQLNVSYNFKQKAQENDLKLRQYMIEKGLNRTTEENQCNAPALYYTSNISIVHNNTDNVDHHLHTTNTNEATPIANSEPATTVAAGGTNLLTNQRTTATIMHPIPIKVEVLDSATENDCRSELIPELNLPNPNLMVIVNDSNALLTQSIPSSNSTSTLPLSGSSSCTNENNLRDSEFLRNYVQNKVNFDTAIEKNSKKPAKIDHRHIKIQKMLKSNKEKFLMRHINKNLGKTVNQHSTKPDMKVSLDLRNLILDQKDNFSSVLKMRNKNTKLLYSLRGKQQNKAKPGRPNKKKKVKNANHQDTNKMSNRTN